MEPYHYTESGLDDVWLLDGVEIEQHPEFGELVSIRHVRSLHRAIVEALITRRRRLNGAELRFLRIELDLSQHALAELIGSDEQSVAKWEKARAKPIGNRIADRMVRVVCLDNAATGEQLADMLGSIADLEAPLAELGMHMRHEGDAWRCAPSSSPPPT